MRSRTTSPQLCFAILVLTVTAAVAQTSPSRTKSRAANVVSGTLATTDAAAGTIGVKSRAGTETLYRYTEKTQMWRAKKPAEISGFKTGDSVFVRFRKSAVGPATLYDLADAASWAWVDRLRHETAQVTVKEIDEQSLHATEGADAAEYTYRVTDKTQWSKGGKAAAPADFKAGDKVYVVPRLLPGGATMAMAISDASNDAAKLKERARFTVSGTIRQLNVEKRTLAIHTTAGDDRELALLPDCAIRMAGKDVPLSYLRPGQAVSLHLSRDDAGDQVVKQVTIKGKTTKKLPSKAGTKKPAAP